MIGGIALTQEMLDFCAEHGIGAEVEVIAADQVNEAYERVLASDVRYRFVIDTATLDLRPVPGRRRQVEGRRSSLPEPGRLGAVPAFEPFRAVRYAATYDLAAGHRAAVRRPLRRRRRRAGRARPAQHRPRRRPARR